MLPASTRSPPNFLRPSRFDSESRPFLVLPPAFLCAMTRSRSMTTVGSADDAGGLHFGIGLAVRALPQVVLAATEFDDTPLVALAVTLHGRDDFAAAQERRADLDAVALPDQQHLLEFDVGTG